MAEGTENYADVYDMADLFTDEEEQQLSGQAQTLSEKMKMEAVIVTTEENSDSAPGVCGRILHGGRLWNRL